MSKEIPNGLVVLTFDDRSRTWIELVAPLLKNYGFNATFFVTEATWLHYHDDPAIWISWEELARLNADGFEIANHTMNHEDVTSLSVEENIAEMAGIENLCEANGIPVPVSFGYPSGPHGMTAIEALERTRYLFGRRGVTPEYQDYANGGAGPLYDPEEDHPYLIPSSFIWGSSFSADSLSGEMYGYAREAAPKFDDLADKVKSAKNGKVAVLTFHGIPDGYPHASTDPDVFRRITSFLRNERCTVIALRDLREYVDPNRKPDDPYEIIKNRTQDK